MKARRSLPFFALAILCLFFLACVIPGGEIAPLLLIGWVRFLIRVMPQTTWHADAALSGLAYLALLIVGTHLFFRWLYRATRNPSPINTTADSPDLQPSRPLAWRWRWTFSLIAIVLVMFSAGMAAVGVGHQVAWLARSPEGIFMLRQSPANRVRCGSNLRQIAMACLVYEVEHGKLPPDFETIVLQSELPLSYFQCPSVDFPDRFKMYGDSSRVDFARHVHDPDVCRYRYLGAGRRSGDSQVWPLIVEFPANHQSRYLNVAYSDASVVTLQGEEMESLLLKLGYERVEEPTNR